MEGVGVNLHGAGSAVTSTRSSLDSNVSTESVRTKERTDAEFSMNYVRPRMEIPNAGIYCYVDFN